MVDAPPNAEWPRSSAWAGIAVENSADATRSVGVHAAVREGLGVASVIARRGSEGALSRLVATRYGLELPTTCRAVCGAAHALLWSGPGRWLAVAERGERFADLSEAAAVTDQSDALATMRLTGQYVRDMLAKGCMIDLHPRAFPPGAAALISIAHMGVHLWRIDQGADDGDPAFDLLVARSTVASFWSWVAASAAEFGWKVSRSR